MQVFLPDNLVMVDCEMVGVVPQRDALLQVAMLKLKLDNNQYVVSPDFFVEYLSYPGKPETKFHKEFLVHIFDACNKSSLTSGALKSKIHAWLGDLKGVVTPVGDCVSTDINFLLHNGCIDQPDIAPDGKPIPGTFHYESFDLNPVKLIVRHKAGDKIKPQRMLSQAHDAFIDCLNQTQELNFYLNKLLG